MSFVGGGSVKGEIALADGGKGYFESDLPLHYFKDSGKHSIPIADVRSVVRCDEDTSLALAPQTEARAKVVTVKKQPSIQQEADHIELSNGDVLYGKVTTPEFQWQAPYAQLAFKREQIQEISLDKAAGTGLLGLKSGDRISGFLENRYVEITLEYGQRVPLASEMITTIRFR